jgi:hypothetical protein
MRALLNPLAQIDSTSGSSPCQGCRLYTSWNDRTMLHWPPFIPPSLGGDRNSKSPRIGGFRGQDRWKQLTRNLCISRSLAKERFMRALLNPLTQI